jgi:aryl-alcohol dehydrogenase-like predicted oxidoreductase
MDALAAHGRVETLQPPYHLFRRDIETEILPYAAENDIGVLIYGPLAHGLLSGRMQPATTFPANDWRQHSADFSGETFRQNLAVVDRLRVFAADRRLSLPTLAVGWSIAHPAVHAAIVGARRASHLDELVAAADVVLSPSDLQEIDVILDDAAAVHGPSPEGM